MRLDDGQRAMRRDNPAATSMWRYYPWFVAAAMSVVIVVNIGMVTAALRTFPGQAGGGGFDLSNRYNAVIAHTHEQASLGWTVQAEIDPAGHPVLHLIDAHGVALAGATVTATAERPLGDSQTTPIAFRDAGGGRYVGDVALPTHGQWQLLLSAVARGQELTTTKRIIVR